MKTSDSSHQTVETGVNCFLLRQASVTCFGVRFTICVMRAVRCLRLFSAPDTSLFVSVCFSAAETFSPDVDGRGLGYQAPLPQPTLWAWFCGLGNRALDSLGSGSQDQVDAGLTDPATPQHCTRLLSQTLGSPFSSVFPLGSGVVRSNSVNQVS